MVPPEEVQELISRDVPKAIELFREMNANAAQVAQLVDDMLARVKRGELSTAKGLSFLEVKYHMLLSYLINLTYVVLRKCTGEPIEADPAIDRLVELRTVLEKTRPIEHKLKYQVDKLVKAAVTGVACQNDPTNFKPNPNDIVSKGDEVGDSSDEDDEDSGAKPSSSKGVYVPPKLASVPYDDDTREEREQRRLERAKMRALSSSMIEELKEEYLDTPVEVSARPEISVARRARETRLERERQEYEENYFTRLPTTKSDRRKSSSNLADELTGTSSGSSRKRKLTKFKGKKHIKKKRTK